MAVKVFTSVVAVAVACAAVIGIAVGGLRSVEEKSKVVYEHGVTPIQLLASLYHPDGPNDVSPSGFPAHEPVAGLDHTEAQVWTMDGLAVTAAQTLAYLGNDWRMI